MNERLILTALQTLLCIENEEPYTQTDLSALIQQIQSAIDALPVPVPNPAASSTEPGLAKLAKQAVPAPVVHRCPSCGCVYSDINDLVA
jgi:hypothetical protein